MATYVSGAAIITSFGYAGGGTFNNLNGGVNFPDGALVVVGISSLDGAADILDTPKIGGVDATIVPGTLDATGDTSALYQAVMSGSSPDTFTFNQFLDVVGISACYMTGMNPTVSAAAKSDYGVGSDPESAGAITVPAGGFGVAFGSAINSVTLLVPNTVTWANTTSGSGDNHAQDTTHGVEISLAHTATAGSWTPTVSGNIIPWSAISSVGIAAWAPIASGALRRYGGMDGLGASGPFFADPLG